MEKMEFLPIRQKLWDRLNGIAAKEIMDPGDREDECILSRLFWEYGFVENRLRYPIKPWVADGLTAIQRRILISATYNSPITEI